MTPALAVRLRAVPKNWKLAGGYLRIASAGPITFDRETLGFKPAVWYGAVTGGLVGRITEFSRDTLRIEGV